MAEHYEVARLEEQTEEQFNTRSRGTHGVTIDGFVTALKAEMPYLKFRSTQAYNSEVAVYREGDALAMGWIGYGDYSPGVSSVKRYTVFSLNIDNGKYSKSSNQRNMAMTTDLGKAVKLVKKHLRPIPTEVAAKHSLTELNYAYAEAHKGARKLLDESRRAIVGASGDVFLNPALENVFALLRMQEQPIGDAVFNAHVNNYFIAKDAMAEAKTLHGDIYFVHPQMKFGEPVYNLVSITWNQTVPSVLPRFHVMESLAAAYAAAVGVDMEAIKGRVAVLHMMQTNEFVVGVGMKVDANRYFVVV